MSTKKKELTAKQKAFCEEFIIDFNGTQAAIRAGYSKRSAEKIATENRQKPEIKLYIQQLINKRSNKTAITAENVLKEIARLAFSDIREVFNEDGGLINPKFMADEISSAVQSVDVVTSYESDEEGNRVPVHTKKIKLADKTKNLELLSKHLGLLTEKVELTKKVKVMDYTGEDEL